jgi:hypothetical protein
MTFKYIQAKKEGNARSQQTQFNPFKQPAFDPFIKVAKLSRLPTENLHCIQTC